MLGYSAMRLRAGPRGGCDDKYRCRTEFERLPISRITEEGHTEFRMFVPSVWIIGQDRCTILRSASRVMSFVVSVEFPFNISG